MKTSIYIKTMLTITVLLCALYISCAGIDTKQSNAWLSSKAGKSTFDITGKWDAGGVFTGGWGQGNLLQEENKVYGTLGLYNVNGVINDDEVFLVLSSGGRLYYTAKLKISENGTKISGRACEDAIIGSPAAGQKNNFAVFMKKTE